MGVVPRPGQEPAGEMVLTTKYEAWLPFLALTGAMILWGSSFVAMKFAFQGLDPLLVIWGRMVVGCVCFLPWLLRLSRVRIRNRDLLPLLAMALCEPCLYFLFEAKALTLTSAAQASLITTLLPLMVAMAALWLLGERLGPRMVCGLFLAAIGAVWLTLAGQPDRQAPDPVLGNLLEFLAMVCATGYIILLKKLSGRLPPFFLTAVQSLTGVLFFSVLLLLRGIPELTAPVSAWLAVLYLGAAVTFGAYGLYNYGVSRVEASRAAIFINSIPVWTIVLGFFLLGERLSPGQAAASVLILTGVMLSGNGGKP